MSVERMLQCESTTPHVFGYNQGMPFWLSNLISDVDKLKSSKKLSALFAIFVTSLFHYLLTFKWLYRVSMRKHADPSIILRNPRHLLLSE